ncbi:hypothetical protein ACFQX7_23910 [Luedemannella flava]
MPAVLHAGSAARTTANAPSPTPATAYVSQARTGCPVSTSSGSAVGSASADSARGVVSSSATATAGTGQRLAAASSGTPSAAAPMASVRITGRDAPAVAAPAATAPGAATRAAATATPGTSAIRLPRATAAAATPRPAMTTPASAAVTVSGRTIAAPTAYVPSRAAMVSRSRARSGSSMSAAPMPTATASRPAMRTGDHHGSASAAGMDSPASDRATKPTRASFGSGSRITAAAAASSSVAGTCQPNGAVALARSVQPARSATPHGVPARMTLAASRTATDAVTAAMMPPRMAAPSRGPRCQSSGSRFTTTDSSTTMAVMSTRSMPGAASPTRAATAQARPAVAPAAPRFTPSRVRSRRWKRGGATTWSPVAARANAPTADGAIRAAANRVWLPPSSTVTSNTRALIDAIAEASSRMASGTLRLVRPSSLTVYTRPSRATATAPPAVIVRGVSPASCASAAAATLTATANRPTATRAGASTSSRDARAYTATGRETVAPPPARSPTRSA